MATSTLSLCFCLSVCVAFVYGDFCHISMYNRYGYSYSYYAYCVFSCCGYYDNAHCCSYTGPTAGIVFGVIAFIGIIIALSIIYRRRRLATSGVVVTTGGIANAGFVSTTTMQQGTVVLPQSVQYPEQYPTQYTNQYPAQYPVYLQPPAYTSK